MAVVQTLSLLQRNSFVPSRMVYFFASFGQQVQQNTNCQIHCPNYISHLFYDHSNWCSLFADIPDRQRFDAPILD